MTDNERQLLRAQLLIEAADLLDEGYNKPNTNDKIDSYYLRKGLEDEYKKALKSGDAKKIKEIQDRWKTASPKNLSKLSSKYNSEEKRPLNKNEKYFGNYGTNIGNIRITHDTERTSGEKRFGDPYIILHRGDINRKNAAKYTPPIPGRYIPLKSQEKD